MAAIKLVKKLNRVEDLRVPGSFRYDIKNNGISQSILGRAVGCPRAFLYTMNGLHDPIREKGYAYGGMNHEVLDWLYSGYKAGDYRLRDFDEVIRICLDKYRLPKVFKTAEQEKLKAIAQAVLECYWRYYKKDFTESKMISVERTFSVPFGKYVLRGKIDGCLRDKNGEVWHLEHKNYSRINEETMQKKLSFDLQNLFYLLAEFIETGRFLRGVKYNILRKPDVKKFDRPVEIYKYLRELIPKNPEYYFIRYEIPYTRRELEQFKKELERKLGWLDGMVAEGRSLQKNKKPLEIRTVFYKNEAMCEGKYTCDFLNICSSGCTVGYKKRKDLFPELGVNEYKRPKSINTRPSRPNPVKKRANKNTPAKTGRVRTVRPKQKK